MNEIFYQKPIGIIFTGDITNWNFSFKNHLQFLAKNIDASINIYFVYGNHCVWVSSFEEIKKQIRELSLKHNNLIWLTDNKPLALNDNTGIIGIEGWYDGRNGNTKYLTYTFDWFLIKELRQLPNMKSRIEMFRELAEKNSNIIVEKLKLAFETFKTVYLCTHFPPYTQADRLNSLLGKKFWDPYNSNIIMGEKLNDFMKEYKKKRLIILSGHTHSPVNIYPTNNIECKVGRGAYNKLSEEEIIYL